MDVSVILQAIGTLVVVAGIGFAAKQLQDVRVNRQLTAINLMFRDFHDEAAYERRYRVLAGPVMDFEKLTDSEFLDRMQVADFYQRIGYLCRCGFLDRVHVMEMYGGAIRSAWTTLKPFVQMRRRDEDLPTYSRDFEMLAQAAFAFEDGRGR